MLTWFLKNEGHYNEQCQRTTRAGARCKHTITDYFSSACSTHMTVEEKRKSAAALKLCEFGWNSAKEYYSKEYERGKKDALKELQESQALMSDPALRLEDALGRQLIRLDAYTYAWNGPEPLRVGDEVWRPPNWIFPMRTRATVTGLGSTYRGEIAEITQKVVDLPL